jgi:phosphohistidine phosphatase
MKELYMIRHALAGSSLENEVDDEARPLKKKGKDKMKAIAKGLKGQKISFDIILTSPLLRSQESAGILNEYCGSNKEATVTDLLKPGSSYNNLIKFLNKSKSAEKIAIVGHEPFLSGFASYCLSKSETSFINLNKSGVLRLEIEKIIKPGQCILSWLIDPKFLI